MSHAFVPDDPEARTFFDEHGYVVLEPQLSTEERGALRRALDALWTRFSAEQGVPRDVYLATLSQWRDLWRADEAFRAALGDPRLWSAAACFMRRGGARLLHDHVIAKPAHGSGTIPWHQDYPYWPVDTSEGLSCWCPLEDVGPDRGCLEVIDGSHRWGESPPADFLAEDRRAFDARGDRVCLPVLAGSVVVLQSLTWHRSGPNVDAGIRPAYISLWLPPDARYAPEHSRWHPVNEHVTVAAGEILNDDWFPCFGERGSRAATPRPRAPSGPAQGSGLSMFNASATIGAQLRAILALHGEAARGEIPRGLGPLLAHEGAIETIVRETLLAGVAPPGDEPAIRAALEDLRVTSEAYRLHRARNVYNGAYVAWWAVAGAAWEARLGAPVDVARAVGA